MNSGDRHSTGLGRIIFDMVLVIISVLLTLALGKWREDREKQALTRNVLAALTQGINANRKTIDAALPFQDRTTQAFREANDRFTKS